MYNKDTISREPKTKAGVVLAFFIAIKQYV